MELIKLNKKTQVVLRFYEFSEDNQLGPKFKKDLSEVEFFYNDMDSHFKNKVRFIF
jgi:hypothetical protein